RNSDGEYCVIRIGKALPFCEFRPCRGGPAVRSSMNRITCAHDGTSVSGAGLDRQQLAFALGRAVPTADEGQVLAEQLGVSADVAAATFSRGVSGWRLIGSVRVTATRGTELPLELAPEQWLAETEGGTWIGCSLLHGRRVVGRLIYRGDPI